MRAIVFGATGYVGRNLTRYLADSGCETAALVRSSSDVSVLPPETEIIVCDAQDAASMADAMKNKRYDIFYSLAWPGSSGEKRNDPAIQMNSARLSTECSMAAVRSGCRRFVFVGTMAQYYVKYDNGRESAKDFYGISKSYAERMTRLVCSEEDAEHISVLLPSVYGDGADAGLFSYIFKKLLKNETLTLEDGMVVTDFLHVSDAVRGIRLAGEKGKAFSSYFAGSGKPRTVREYADIIKDRTGSVSEIISGSAAPKSGLRKELSPDALTRDTGFIPGTEFEDGVTSELEGRLSFLP